MIHSLLPSSTGNRANFRGVIRAFGQTAAGAAAILFLTAMAAVSSAAEPAAATPAPSDFTALINKDLSAWNLPDPNPWWSVKGGVLIGESDEKLRGNVLETKRDYGDVIVETEVRFADGIDSGIFLRSPHEGFQVQIGVSRSLKKDMTGSVYLPKLGYTGLAHDVDKLLKLNEWNTLRVEAKGAHFKVSLNGQEVLDYENANYPKPGPIGLQIHPHVKMKVEFRNLRVKELAASEGK